MNSGPPKDSRYHQTFVDMAQTKKGYGHQARPVGVYLDSIIAAIKEKRGTCPGSMRCCQVAY